MKQPCGFTDEKPHHYASGHTAQVRESSPASHLAFFPPAPCACGASLIYYISVSVYADMCVGMPLKLYLIYWYTLVYIGILKGPHIKSAKSQASLFSISLGMMS